MGSLWKRDNSPYWFCCYRDASGKRVKKSTKLKDRRKAMRVCIELEEAAHKAAQGRLTESMARKLISELVEQSTGDEMQFYTLKEWCDEWMLQKKTTSSPATAIRYEAVLRNFSNYLGKRASLNLAHITPSDIRKFRDAQLETGKSNSSCNMELKIIRGVFNDAKRMGYVPSNPADALQLLSAEKVEKGTFTLHHVNALLAVASDEWRGVILMGFYTGARLTDITRMKWSSVSLGKKLITFMPQKTKKSRKTLTLPIHGQLYKYLRHQFVNHKSSDYIFPELSKGNTAGRSGLSQQFQRIMLAAGIKPETDRSRKGKGAHGVSKYSFHSFRHSFNSILANKGVSQELRQKLTGHASASVNDGYTHHEIDSFRNAIAELPDLG